MSRDKLKHLRLSYANEIRREIRRRYRNGSSREMLRTEYGLKRWELDTMLQGNAGVPGRGCDFESMYRTMGRPRK